MMSRIAWYPKDKYESIRPVCTECEREIMDGEWWEFRELVICSRCLRLNHHYIDELLEEE